MTTSFSDRKRTEFEQKLNSLDEEFTHWLAQSEDKQPYEKHNSQVRAITTVLRQLQTDVRTAIAAAATPDDVLGGGQAATQMMLAVHRIWEYFRSKLVQRREARLAEYLQVADEFAWACYEPVLLCTNRQQPGAYRKEPPLVFFNGGSSPFSVSRQRSFEGEAVPNELLTGARLREVLKSLPIPVIGVPWVQVAHLPDALVIGHEVGHTVEDDFGLTATLEAHLQTVLDAQIDSARHAAWRAWMGELFADLFGCVATGPAFVASLRDFLVLPTTALQQENRLSPKWGDYPTNHLRMRCNFAALREMGFVTEADALEASWLAHCPSGQLEAFVPDIQIVVSALLHCPLPPLGQQSLLTFEYPNARKQKKLEPFCFNAEQQALAQRTVIGLQKREGLQHTNDVRVLLAGNYLAFAADPAAYVARQDAARIRTRIKNLIAAGTRASTGAKTKAQLDDDKKLNTQTGQNLFAQLATWRSQS